ncbi:MAG: DUF2764 family protein [Thermodesulfobacteriota bacterium]
MSYTYLAASLPELTLGQPPPMGLGTFTAQCQGVLEAPALWDVQQLVQGDFLELSTTPGQKWQALETQIRNETATALRPNQDLTHPFFIGYSVFVRDCVRRAFDAATPLERERILDRGRFALLADLAGHDPLGLSRIVSFAGQLRLVHRWAVWDQETGRERFDEMVATVAEAVLAQ